MIPKRICPKCKGTKFWEKVEPNVTTWKCLTEGCGHRIQKYYRRKGG